jgi:hypothetical protein
MQKKPKLEEKENTPTPGFMARNELDTRADTICAGANFCCLRPTGMTCSVQGFHQSFEPIPEIPVATVATAWDDQNTGQTYILIIHQALYFGTQLDHSLINPNQIRVTGIPVCDDPYDRHRHLGIDLGDVQIPFYTEGSTIYFNSRVPMKGELDDCQYLTLTDDDDWDPTETDLIDHVPKEIKAVISRGDFSMESESDQILSDISSIYSHAKIANRAAQSVRIVSQVASKTRHSKVTPEHLARAWNVGLDRAKETLRVTTQKGIRYSIHPIHRRYPVTSTAKAGETLADFARDVGVPTDLRADLGSYFTGRDTEFVKESKRLRIKVTYAEKGRHNQNHAAEREIRDLKRRWHNKMVEKRAPKRLWDFGIVHQSELMSRMSRPIVA